MPNTIPEKIDRRRIYAYTLASIGLAGLIYGQHIQPDHLGSVFDSAKWIFTSTISTVFIFVGLMGISSRWLTPYHLKVIDLIWVSASAIAVSLAAVHSTQTPAVEYRKIVNKNIEKSRDTAKLSIASAYSDECLSHHTLSTQQCEQLRRLGIALEGDGYLSPEIVGAICPRPINLDSPPRNYNRALIEGCINAGYAVYATDDPIMIDESNTERWTHYMTLWPYIMIFLVSLRVAKSAGEVFWKIK
ncbi:hypothetical protein [Burkholderia pseudomultivorans]|uniref:hypothetical protein n=1 Tax=Burkholderia pseudomultivorans TaxID=1207504 RepID=UPI00188DC8A3|nr:hypothetical protein [Burkholderia pseudomultivorans]MBF5014630.1 hypothetical protein [Burkholderia pseudomultivorans]